MRSVSWSSLSRLAALRPTEWRKSWERSRSRLKRGMLAASLVALLLGEASRAQAGLVITPTFTANFNSNFGANAAAAQAAWIAAANVFSNNFTDSIHINITVDAVAGTGVFGQSSTNLDPFSYATLRNAVVADAKTANDLTAVGAGGSVTAADPTGGAGTWWVSTAQAKALGLISDNLSNDGTTRFGAGNPFTFSGPVAAGTYDFQGVAAHEISEVMGRLGISGGTIGSTTNSYSLVDLYSYTGAGTRDLGNGPGSFSIDNGTTLIKAYNNASSNGLDTRDWAPGTNDSFNQFSNSGVANPVSAVDLQEMDVIGYDLGSGASATPEPASLTMLGIGIAGLAGYGWRRRKQSLPA
jgi:hypothetical protein